MSGVVVVEGDTDLPVVRKLLAEAGLAGARAIDCGGKGNLDRELEGYISAARGAPWIVLRDLDHDEPCAAALVQRLCPNPTPWLSLRVAVRAVEAWLLADRSAFAQFFAVPEARVPRHPDVEHNPTLSIVNLGRLSRSPSIRQGIVPREGSGTMVGPRFEALMIEFGTKKWDPSRASRNSQSLSRARTAIRDLGARWLAYIEAG